MSTVHVTRELFLEEPKEEPKKKLEEPKKKLEEPKKKLLLELLIDDTHFLQFPS